MLITTGKVRDGAIEIDAKSLPEGDESFELDPAEETLLLAAIEEAERGDTLSASQLLRRIPKS